MTVSEPLQEARKEWARVVAKTLLNEVWPLLKKHPKREEAMELNPDQVEFIVWARCMGYITGKELRCALIMYFDRLAEQT